MNNNLIVLRQLDEQLSGLEACNAYFLPKVGWARTVRKALGMTIKQLAGRLGVASSRVVKIETSEVEGAVTLRTLQALAEALDCRFVYSFMPNRTLEETVKRQASQVAAEHVQRTLHTMDLEAQSVEKAWVEDQKKDLADELLRKSWKHLWTQ